VYRSGMAKSRGRRFDMRGYILDKGLKPYPSHENWDGFQVIEPDGTKMHTSDRLRGEMRKMIAEGHFNPPETFF